MRKVRLAHYALGLYGVAVIRNWLQGDEVVAAQVRELREFAATLDQNPRNVEFELHDKDVTSGYAAWSVTYDEPVNPLVRLEQPIVQSFIDDIPPGRALDAACGTGRHTEYLCARGFDTTGVDVTPEMLARARAKVPTARFVTGDLASLDFPDGSFDLVVCALDHCPDLGRCVGEIARVVRRGGSVIISVFHPMSALLGGGAFYRGADGQQGVVDKAEHGIADYITAFVQSGLEINACVEPAWGKREVAMMQGAIALLKPETLGAALIGIPCALVWRLARR
jgi:SAM-dependent methyltransferase